ncbi:MAG: MerR family transcriptional regulator, heat shock protein HspR [Pseudonocardiales bacterium]|jgi:DNA-binding transcriptional MerR regulator|nr:MerR family transcriptional regulator, heat shock protein HspR [Pseudonocardiales bacterium]
MGIQQPDPNRGLYGITVAAELVGSGPQNLRQYEARGLLTPQRTAGGTRRYSENDLDRLRDIAGLLDAGLNLAGVEMVLALRTANSQLRAEIDKLSGTPAQRPPRRGRAADRRTRRAGDPADDSSGKKASS